MNIEKSDGELQNIIDYKNGFYGKLDSVFVKEKAQDIEYIERVGIENNSDEDVDDPEK